LYIYVDTPPLRGEINETVDDPFHGFNIGSAHTRVNQEGNPSQFFFESPLVRLISDYGYRDVYQGEKQALPDDVPHPQKTIWIYRYYDAAADTYTHRPRRWSIEESARELRLLIAEIKKQTGAPRVHLVAHSMGGLVCRSLLQKIYPENNERGDEHVARFFTYGTPHGGIQFRTGLGLLERIRDAIGALSSDDFGPDRMYTYLTPHSEKTERPENFEQYAVDPKHFNPDNIFCAIGTNARDYEVAFGASRASVGPQSDGLVQIGAAYVKGAHRAYVHRSHSGRYGIVNSEEAFQNLERFLFGNIQAELALQGVRPLPDPSQQSYQVDVRVSVRGLPVYMNEQTRDHFCPIILNDRDNQPVPRHPIFTQFLNTKFSQDGRARFAVNLAFKRLRMKEGEIDYDDMLHGVPTWTDTVIIDVILGKRPRLALRWSLAGGDKPPRMVELEGIAEGGHRAVVPLPKGKARDILGEDAALVISAWDWTLT
jgi:pimeloyl-ACP methyl ester carboxylesterase